MSKTKIFLIAALIVVIIVVWGAASAIKKLTSVPETFTVGEAFIEHLAAGEFDQASALTVAELQSADNVASLKAFVAERPELFTNSTQVNLTGRGIDDELRYAYGTLTSGEIESPLYMEFLDENGETRVSYFSFNQEDIPQYDNEE